MLFPRITSEARRTNLCAVTVVDNHLDVRMWSTRLLFNTIDFIEIGGHQETINGGDNLGVFRAFLYFISFLPFFHRRHLTSRCCSLSWNVKCIVYFIVIELSHRAPIAIRFFSFFLFSKHFYYTSLSLFQFENFYSLLFIFLFALYCRHELSKYFNLLFFTLLKHRTFIGQILLFPI